MLSGGKLTGRAEAGSRQERWAELSAPAEHSGHSATQLVFTPDAQPKSSAPAPWLLCVAPIITGKDGYQTKAWSRQKAPGKTLPSSSVQGVGKAAAPSSQLY